MIRIRRSINKNKKEKNVDIGLSTLSARLISISISLWANELPNRSQLKCIIM